jgi:hypothetical protein
MSGKLAGHWPVAASPSRQPLRGFLRMRPPGKNLDFLIPRASARRQGDLILRGLRSNRLEGEVALLRVRTSASKDGEIHHAR